eukprot:3355931-Rhodomonas_salina.1
MTNRLNRERAGRRGFRYLDSHARITGEIGQDTQSLDNKPLRNTLECHRPRPDATAHATDTQFKPLNTKAV